MGLFKFSERVRETERLAITSATKHQYEPTPIPTRDVFIKTCLDQNEGPTKAEGRYRTFYNMYWVDIAWYMAENNRELLSNRIPSFVVIQYPNLSRVFTDGAYSSEFLEWIRTAGSKYYQVLPISSMYKGKFKFSGVSIPKEYTTAKDKFTLNANYIEVLDTCIFGKWVNHLYKHCDDVRAKKQYHNTTDRMALWLVSEIEALGHHVAHA